MSRMQHISDRMPHEMGFLAAIIKHEMAVSNMPMNEAPDWLDPHPI